MQYKLIEEPHEIEKLAICIKDLSKHHNAINTRFDGIYPMNPVEQTIEKFKEEIIEKKSRLIYAVFIDEHIEGFCSLSFKDNQGSIDYLYIKESSRNNGYGTILIDWAMNEFKRRKIKLIDVKVVKGNPAENLYKKFGFETRINLMSRFANEEI